MDIHTDQLTQLLREQIEKFDGSVDVAEVGEVIEVGDGVARASGLENVMSSELITFSKPETRATPSPT